MAPLKAYSRRMQSVQESLNAPIISLETGIEQVSNSIDNLNLPIALKKGNRQCTQHPLSNFVSFDNLSPIWFEAILGLKINVTKSELILVGRTENLDELALVLGCKVGVLPTTYLELPLGAPYNSLVSWD